MTFDSRRNTVTLEGGTVVKTYTDLRCRLTEERLLEQLKDAGLAVASILTSREDSLTLEYIDGNVYAQMIEELTVEHIVALIEWQQAYYAAAPGLGRADINLRNYIFSEGKCIGLDFEEVSLTSPLEDYGRLLAFLATYYPAISDAKKSVVKTFFEQLQLRGFKRQDLRPYIYQELHFMQRRRAHKAGWAKEIQSWFEKL